MTPINAVGASVLEPAIEFRNPGNTIMIQKDDRFSKSFRERYDLFVRHFSDFHFYTFDKANLREFEFDFRGKILFNGRGLHSVLYAFLSPWLHRRQLAAARYYFALQAPAALYPWYCSLFFRDKKVVVFWNYDWVQMARSIGRSRLYCLFVRAWTYASHKLISRFVTTNEADRQIILSGNAKARVLVLPTSVDMHHYASTGEPRRPRSLLFVGRLAKQKNLENLIAAVSEIPDVELNLVGDGELRDQLKDEAQRLGARVIFHGARNREEIIALYNQCALFTLPSRFEGISNALIEAMACRLPVMTSDIYTSRQVIQHGVNGLLCTIESDSIRDTIRYAIDHPDEMKAMAEEAWKAVQRDYSTENYFSRLVEFVEN